MLISVVVVTYQSAHCLPACLRSLEQANGASRMELILVDNASPDETKALLDAYERRTDLPFARVQTLALSENRGYAYANNRGLALAQGDLLLLLNPDTVVTPDAIVRCAAVLKDEASFRAEAAVALASTAGPVSTSDPVSSSGTFIDAAHAVQAQGARIGVVGCRLELPDGTLDRACKRSFPTLTNSFFRFSGLSLLFPQSKRLAAYNLTYLEERGSFPVESVCGAFLLTTREVYEQVGDLDEDYFMYGEDLDWCYRIKRQGFGVWYEGGVTTLHLKGGNGGKRSAASLRHFYQTMLIFFQKHYKNRYPVLVFHLVRVGLAVLFYSHITVQNVRGRRDRPSSNFLCIESKKREM
ncbi:glycosyltransferase family 2 protein [Ferroacidibacillus organovorans]|uniref:glycosyltransferase family 2 protein n=1 Tax=Ferroacidibacillus organovorans TaxID=1765683 RepID=UPI0015C41780|nr:glycosyltransferase family 2 protein [Ferroacidibacillus organovorans]